MSDLSQLTAPQLEAQKATLTERYAAIVSRGLKLDMTRGKPASAQLELAANLATALPVGDHTSSDGTDVRNYGGLEGIKEMRVLFGELLGAPAEQVVIGGNSSLEMMHNTVVRALLHGVVGSEAPWGRVTTKFLCPAPGYDRHFAICEHHGIEMLTVPLGGDGPDMDVVERLVAEDATIRGMWCVPKYSNPTGITYSDAVVRRLAAMKTAAPDFRLFWDNAYVVHDLTDTSDELSNVLLACKEANTENRPFVFGSTSKISWAGAGIAAMASSPANIADVKKHLSFQTIGPDKANQLRHMRLFPDLAAIRAHMRRHAAIMAPKFDAVCSVFERNLGGRGIASWTRPKGGYFVSLDTLRGCAKRVVSLSDAAGVKLTPAGATFPYGRDPEDKNIRIAPSLPPRDQVELAMEVVSTCVELAAVERLLG